MRSLQAIARRISEQPPWFRFTVLPLGIAALLVTLLVTVDLAAAWGRVHPGVRVEGVALGGLTEERARDRIAGMAAEQLALPVRLTFEEESWEVTAEQVGASVDASGQARAAMEVGRRGGLLDRVAERGRAWVRPVETGLTVELDPVKTDPLLDKVSESVLRPPRDAEVAIEDGEAVLVPSQVGLEMQREAVEADLRDAFVGEERSVEVAVDFTPAEVSDEGALGALQDAKRILDGPVVVEHEGDRWEFPVKSLSGWIAFRKVPRTERAVAGAEEISSVAGSQEASTPVGDVAMALEAFIDPEPLGETLGPKVGGVGREPEDARFEVSGGKVRIIPSKDGIGPDMKALAKEMGVKLTSDGERVVTLRTRRVKPEITTAEAEKMGIRERISTFSTSYSASNKPRVNNIHTLAKALDGTLVAPGETFSFNGAIGPRTAEKGYKEAPAIVNGRLVPQLGGGICQVGTTIFNTVFFSGLPVVERHNHSFYIDHYPKGRDATVSWGGPDFKFRNDTSRWVLIKTAFASSSLTVSLYGTDPGYEVRHETGAFTDIRPHGVNEKRDDTLLEGARVIEDGGVDGRKVVVTRTVLKDGKIVRTDTFNSSYRPKEEIVRVGTKRVEEDPEPEPEPEESEATAG